MIDTQQIVDRDLRDRWVLPPHHPAVAALDCNDEVQEWLTDERGMIFAFVPESEYPTIAILPEAQPALEQRFGKLANEWSRETMHISSASDLINDKRYQEIIGLGWDAVPYLLTDLQKNKRFWFPALAAITGVRPFDAGDSSNPRRMTEAWVRWGKRKGLI